MVHPSKKIRQFNEKQSAVHSDQIVEAKTAVYSLYNEYRRRHANEAIRPLGPVKELSKFHKYNRVKPDYESSDDLDRYLCKDLALEDADLLGQQQFNYYRYLILHYIALDLLVALASSSVDERQFSKADQTLNKERFNTKSDSAEANQCLKSWIDEGLIYQTPKKATKRRRTSSSSSSYYYYKLSIGRPSQYLRTSVLITRLGNSDELNQTDNPPRLSDTDRQTNRISQTDRQRQLSCLSV